MAQYTLGLDYGTLSARAVLVDAGNGREVAGAVCEYAHGVMTDALPDGTPLPPDYALQHPQDYLDALYTIVPRVMEISGASPQEVVGIGVDFTASTVLPVDRAGVPLCLKEEWAKEKHAYAKLWKHHAAQRYADRINEGAEKRGEKWLLDYGGRVSCEWSLPKLWEVLEEAPDVYAQMDAWEEAGDWLVRQMTGRATRNACAAGYKHLYQAGEGYPSDEFFAALDHRLSQANAERNTAPILPVYERAGGLLPEIASRLGLLPGTAVTAANVDAHSSAVGGGISRPGQMLAIIGTSTCHMCLSTQDHQAPGICGRVWDGLMPGYWGIEAGQSCVGDGFAWFSERFVPAEYQAAARDKNLSIQQYLTELAGRLEPGESGLLALDWWNGNRSTLVDFDLSGMILGMTLQTRPEEAYRALIEATAYGTRLIMENFREHGIPVSEFFASGGISRKNPLAMQIYADVLGMDVQISASSQGSALGSAVHAAVAAGIYATVEEAARRMVAPPVQIYHPIKAHVEVYERLYREYAEMYQYFGVKNQ
ncbi:MAG: ribulokinase, partial [Clostridia bacterium]|nr:ribulokinase [Clostridia bacterium]